MNCPYPEHHKSGSGIVGEALMGLLIIAVAVAILSTVLHALIIGAACFVLGAGTAAVLFARWRWRQHRAMTGGRCVPQMQAQRQRRQVPQAQQQPELGQGGQHFHLHLGGLTAAERAEVMRQLRGG